MGVDVETPYYNKAPGPLNPAGVSGEIPYYYYFGLRPDWMKVGGMNKYQVGHRLKMFNLLIGNNEEPRSSCIETTESIDPASNERKDPAG